MFHPRGNTSTAVGLRPATPLRSSRASGFAPRSVTAKYSLQPASCRAGTTLQLVFGIYRIRNSCNSFDFETCGIIKVCNGCPSISAIPFPCPNNNFSSASICSPAKSDRLLSTDSLPRPIYIWKLSTAPEDAGKIVAVYLCIANHKKQFLDLPSIKILLIIIRISSAFVLFYLFIPRCVSNPAISSISKIFTVPSPPSSSMENMV